MESMSVAEIIHHYFNRPGVGLQTKQSRLQHAIVDAMAEYRLQAGDQIPPEIDLSKILGVSLGTTQRSLGALARQGLLDRRQGKGTFVAENRIPEDELWHFRFFTDGLDPKYLTVFTKTLHAHLVTASGPWSTSLGLDRKGYVMIARVITVDGRRMCLSRIYLPATRFGSLVDGSMEGVDLSNMKLLLRRNFGVTNTFIEQTIHFTTIDTDDAEELNCDAGATAIVLTVYGHESDGSAISYHEILMPPNESILDLSYSGAPVKFGSFTKGIGKV
ncbi:GntR family transcriptional regulator [Fodinicurvata fenggangensis]|uniref:GntR family transcriptional regulator n=1 Tax=Fodinicurvata fenggangensis TaxID=1121830 RepID=UPI00138E33DA|nr:GntR family transcriptional regulator [Fodinicurvata fenggangensis]